MCHQLHAAVEFARRFVESRDYERLRNDCLTMLCGSGGSQFSFFNEDVVNVKQLASAFVEDFATDRKAISYRLLNQLLLDVDGFGPLADERVRREFGNAWELQVPPRLGKKADYFKFTLCALLQAVLLRQPSSVFDFLCGFTHEVDSALAESHSHPRDVKLELPPSNKMFIFSPVNVDAYRRAWLTDFQNDDDLDSIFLQFVRLFSFNSLPGSLLRFLHLQQADTHLQLHLPPEDFEGLDVFLALKQEGFADHGRLILICVQAQAQSNPSARELQHMLARVVRLAVDRHFAFFF